MSTYLEKIDALLQPGSDVDLKIETMGHFQVSINEHVIDSKSWGRDKTLQLLEFLITSRHRKGLHKEQIISRLWEDADGEAGDRDFKVAMHGINKALEPDRKSRTEPKYIFRQGLTYQLNFNHIWLDIIAIEELIAIGNEVLITEPKVAIKAYSEAIKLYNGPYLPNRLYMDWSSESRERIQVLILGAMINLAQLLVDSNPMESIRQCQKALLIDHTWEDAYRTQMTAYINNGNRPMALKTYAECERVLEEEFGISPLPKTKSLLKEIEQIGIS